MPASQKKTALSKTCKYDKEFIASVEVLRITSHDKYVDRNFYSKCEEEELLEFSSAIKKRSYAQAKILFVGTKVLNYLKQSKN